MPLIGTRSRDRLRVDEKWSGKEGETVNKLMNTENLYISNSLRGSKSDHVCTINVQQCFIGFCSFSEVSRKFVN